MEGIAEFARVVADSFNRLTSRSDVFVADIDPDQVWSLYLASFPEGSNPVFRKRAEHDCATCRQFVKRAGAVVGGSRLEKTVWDEAAESAPGPYRVVAERMRDAVRTAGVRDLFRVKTNELHFGAPKTRVMEKNGEVTTWEHLHTGEVPKSVRVASPDEVRGAYRTTVQVFERGLMELTPEALDTVLSLIDANNLYRGEEHRAAVAEFRAMQTQYLSDSVNAHLFAWANAGSRAARFRNTVIGTLVQDLSEGQDVDRAVRAFETKVAPQNYKRTTAVITPGMVKKAMETIEELGLEPALERRFATLQDVSVNDVKWVDGSVRSVMKGGLGDSLMRHAVAQQGGDRDESEGAADIGIDEFVGSVLPGVTGLEVFFRNELAGNLVSLTAPVHPEPRQLFRWRNDFAWSYGGNVADSIRERVKKAGGRVEGAVLRVSLSWFNYDDLDLHVFEPPGRGVHSIHAHIHFRNKRGWTGGTLDVDMNAGIGSTREAVENVVWTTAPPDGIYLVAVNNFTRRESADPGFVIEVESAGKLAHYSYAKGVPHQGTVKVVALSVKGGVVAGVEIGDPAVLAQNVSQEKWGLRTEQWAKVSAVMLSPNYWGEDRVGNRHTIFALEGCRNDEAARGFYNEFLHPRLEPHRKVFEVIADKTKCRPTDGQLSGLGFSSTKSETFLARVTTSGKKRRVFNVRVGA